MRSRAPDQVCLSQAEARGHRSSLHVEGDQGSVGVGHGELPVAPCLGLERVYDFRLASHAVVDIADVRHPDEDLQARTTDAVPVTARHSFTALDEHQLIGRTAIEV